MHHSLASGPLYCHQEEPPLWLPPIRFPTPFHLDNSRSPTELLPVWKTSLAEPWRWAIITVHAHPHCTLSKLSIYLLLSFQLEVSQGRELSLVPIDILAPDTVPGKEQVLRNTCYMRTRVNVSSCLLDCNIKDVGDFRSPKFLISQSRKLWTKKN